MMETGGMIELVEHENYHKKSRKTFILGLGFDVPQTFGTFSGRDGKRS